MNRAEHAILAALGSAPLTAPQIALRTGLRAPQWVRAIHRLEAAGVVAEDLVLVAGSFPRRIWRLAR
jgi:DNA-binding MarR family transcriptional regulator